MSVSDSTRPIDVSTIIPTYRRLHQLPEAIESVLQQGVSGEIIVVDDCPDGSAKPIVDQFANNGVRYLRNDPPSRGRPAMVRNAGWPLANGRFVHFLDDDDRIANGFYGDVIRRFDANKNVGVIFGHIRPFADDPAANLAHERAYFADASRRARWAGRLRSKRWLVANLLFKSTLLVNSACVLRRDCIAKLNGYQTDLGLNEDVDFFCRAIREFDFEFLDRDAVHYRINPDSLMHGRKDNSLLLDTYRKMHERYRTRHGGAELILLKVLMRTVGRFT